MGAIKRDARIGLTLLEIVVALGLLTLLLPLVFDLIPGGLLAQRRAGTIQAAAAIASQWIEEARSSPPSPNPAGTHIPPARDRDQYVDASGASCHGTRDYFLVPLSAYTTQTTPMWDVVVTITPQRGEPIHLATRIPAP